MRKPSILVVLLTASALGLAGCGSAPNPRPGANHATDPTRPDAVAMQTFATPEAAVAALAEAMAAPSRDPTQALFGPGSLEVLESGDAVVDQQVRDRIAAMIHEKVAFEDREQHKMVLVGNDAWPLAIPLTKTGERWSFDLDAGREELLNRRIGRNELFTIAALQECVAAQREYRATANGDGTRPFAGQFASSAANRDGLYWLAAGDQPASPLGPLFAAAACEEPPIAGHEATALHGYYYRILHCQGKAAPGGELEYVDAAGKMTKGCAFLAWPATYGKSGIMSFVVNHDGVVFEKDLGPESATAVRSIRVFDPDDTWNPARP